ncbi:unnamed protein product [Rhizophagus irregularis]|nr:unnamed protein product [Rhizophagus irregularis]
MIRQTFFLSPKFNKKSIFHSPTNKYQEFVNAYVYSIMVKNGNGTPNRADICSEVAKEWNKIKIKSRPEIDDMIRNYLATSHNLCNMQTIRPLPSAPRKDSHPPLPTLPAIRSADPILEISVNASAQRKAVNEIKIAKKKISEFEQIYNISTDYQFRHDTYLKIGSHRAEIGSNRKRIIKLKRNADYAQKCKEKKKKNTSRRPDVAGVSRTETRDHPDGHYCLASTKYARQFATAFADNSVVISQDDKAKIGLGVPAVGQIFHSLQSVNEPVSVADHDFPLGNAQKLVLSVYFITKLNESNDELRTGQLAIFVRRQWSLGTFSLTHMQDLESLVLDPQYDDVLKTGQSKYNPVERDMATLSGKLAGITLPIDHFGLHLNTQGKVIVPELALRNFRYAGETLCDIWRRDLIFGKKVDAQYVEELSNPFENLEFEDTDKEKAEEQKQQKRKQEKGDDSPECFVPCCCGPPRAKEAMDFLFLNNGFLPPVTKAKDGHFTNAIHLLEYFDLMKIPGYDFHCPSLDQTAYSRLCYSACNKYFPTLTYLMNHKKTLHPVSRGRPKGKSREQNSRVLDNFSLLPSQQKQPLFDETYLRDCMSDKE